MIAHTTEFQRFAAWLTRQAGRPDPVGDLANDLRVCECRTLTSFRQHLRWYGADGAVAALDRAVDEYRGASREPPEAA